MGEGRSHPLQSGRNRTAVVECRDRGFRLRMSPNQFFPIPGNGPDPHTLGESLLDHRRSLCPRGAEHGNGFLHDGSYRC